VAETAGEDGGKPLNVSGEGVQVRAGGPDLGDRGAIVGVEAVRVAQQPRGDRADLGRSPRRRRSAGGGPQRL
jgi:hypothetical protein